MGDNERQSDEDGIFDHLYETYQLNKDYRHHSGFSAAESYRGDGRYPPDWGARRTDVPDPAGGRREAVLDHQDHTCARCRTDLREREYYHCHHYRPISEGGTHELGNLVALCGPCHKLIHPDNHSLDDDWRDAPLFPAPNADPRMATVRRPVTDEERDQYLPELELLELASTEMENTFATSAATYAISPTDAVEARDELQNQLASRNLLPDRTVAVHVVNPIHTPLRDAAVELQLELDGHESYSMRGATDDRGDARFRVPSSTTGMRATVTKDDFDQTTVEVSCADDPVERTIKLTPAADVDVPGSSGGDGGKSRRGLVKAAGALGLLGVGAGVASSGVLPRWGGNGGQVDDGDRDSDGSRDGGARDGTSGASGLASLASEWSFDTETAAPIQSMTVGTERLFATTKVGTVTALGFDGTEQWTVDLRERSTEPTFAFDDRLVVAARNQLLALNPATGDRLWEFTDLPSDTEPTVAASGRYVAATFYDDEEEIVTLSADSGEETWRAQSGSSVGRPTIRGEELFFLDSYAVLTYSDIGTPGTKEPERNRYVDEEAYVSSFGADGGRGYFTYADKRYSGGGGGVVLSAFDFASGSHLWNVGLGHKLYDGELVAPFATGGTVFHGATAYDDSGTTRWSLPDERRPTAGDRPMIVDGHAFYAVDADESTNLVGVSLDDGSVTHETTVDGRIVAGTRYDGSLLVGTEDGRIERLARTE